MRSTVLCRPQNEVSVPCLLRLPWAKKRQSKQGRRGGKQPTPLPLSSSRGSHSNVNAQMCIFINTHPLFSQTQSLLVVMVTKMARMELKEERRSEMWQTSINISSGMIKIKQKYKTTTQHTCIFIFGLCEQAWILMRKLNVNITLQQSTGGWGDKEGCNKSCLVDGDFFQEKHTYIKL